MPRFTDGTAAIDVDDRDPSLLMVTSSGVSTERLTREFFGWLNGFARATLAKNGRYVVVIDARGAGRPAAKVRSLISQLTDELRLAAPGVELASLFIAESALVRGAITALVWISRSSWRPVLVASMEEARLRAAQILRDAGIQPGARV